MGKSLVDFLPAIGVGALTGGIGAAPFAAGDALAAQGAAGLLGSAGAEAAGYAMPSLLGNAALPTIAADGLGATGIAGLDEMMAKSTADALAGSGKGLMGDGVSIGNTIGADGLTANSFTGGYDALNGLDRLGQRIGGFVNDGNMMDVAKTGYQLSGQGQQQPQVAPKNVNQNIQRAPQSPQSPTSFSNNQSQFAPNFGVQDAMNQNMIDEQRRRAFAQKYGYTPNFGG